MTAHEALPWILLGYLFAFIAGCAVTYVVMALSRRRGP